MRRDTFDWQDCLPLRGKWLMRLVIAIMLLPQIATVAVTLFGLDDPWTRLGRWWIELFCP